MVLLQPPQDGALAYAPLLQRSVGGAESNVALALSRLGKKTRWVSRLGNDPFGDIICIRSRRRRRYLLCATRCKCSYGAVFSRDQRLRRADCLLLSARLGGQSALGRRYSAEWMHDARHLHVTGITPALGTHTREAVEAAMRLARELGRSISFDPNLRRKLWDEDTARETLLSLVPLCDIFCRASKKRSFCLVKAMRHKAGAAFLDMGAKIVVIKLGAQGSTAFTAEGHVEAPPFKVERVLDSVGAGDALRRRAFHLAG
jgi:2-dehydro-3-deoxygluconokinase